MKTISKITLILVLLVGYFFIINIFANLMFFSNKITQTNKIGGADLEIGLGESLSVEVVRVPHWYGRFILNSEREYLDLFFICKIPWEIKKINFVWFHVLFLTTFILIIILMFTKKNYKEVKEYEQFSEDRNNTGNLIPDFSF